MTKLPSLAILAVAACWSSSQPNAPRDGIAVDIQIASVALAEDCPDPEAATGAAPTASISCANEDCGSQRWACEQTTIQLTVSSGDAPAKIAIKRIELVDSKGKLIGTMTARNPQRWSGAEYTAWNEAINPRERLTASYALSLPEGDELEISERYLVRVTLSVGGQDRMIEKATTRSAPAILEPGVVT